MCSICSSQEEIESLREKMSAQTSLVVVGSADDALRIKKFNRHMEGITQSMVDNMITDEVHDFVSTCIVNPPGPREVTSYLNRRVVGAVPHEKFIKQKKRKYKENHTNADGAPPRKGFFQFLFNRMTDFDPVLARSRSAAPQQDERNAHRKIQTRTAEANVCHAEAEQREAENGHPEYSPAAKRHTAGQSNVYR